MQRGITITNYLIDGNPEGVIFAYVSNWTGQAIKIPRNSFSDLKGENSLGKPGVYFLIGADYDSPDTTLVYIGEANNVMERLSTHLRDDNKSFFETIVVFTSKDDNLTVSHTKYLEYRIISEIAEGPGLSLKNRKEGTNINLPKMVKDEMDTYFDNLKILLPSIGFDLFTYFEKEEKDQLEEDDLYYLEMGKIKAEAMLTSNNLVVLKGSMFKKKDTDSLHNSYLRMRQNLLSADIVKKDDKNVYRFVSDYSFNSPSAAAVAVLGYSINGRNAWKNSNGKTLNEVEIEKIGEIEVGG